MPSPSSSGRMPPRRSSRAGGCVACAWPTPAVTTAPWRSTDVAVLAFDTATASTVVGVLDGATLVEARHDPPLGGRPEHAPRLLPLVHDVVGDWATIARIGVGIGPGSFTGLRIGIATARALAPVSLRPLYLSVRARALPRPLRAAGDGSVRFREDLQAAGAEVPDDSSPLHRVSARVLCERAAEAEEGPPGTVLPDYLRLPDAEIAYRKRTPT